jgi:hypothetical protein
MIGGEEILWQQMKKRALIISLDSGVESKPQFKDHGE